ARPGLHGIHERSRRAARLIARGRRSRGRSGLLHGRRPRKPAKAMTPLRDGAVDVKVKLAALWTSIMFCYIYADYFGLYVPGKVQGILDGKMGPLGPITQPVLLGASLVVLIPSVMIGLSILLKPALNRPLNMVFAALYTIIILGTMWRWTFYVLFGVVEIALTALVFWYAWKWPRTAPLEASNR